MKETVDAPFEMPQNYGGRNLAIEGSDEFSHSEGMSFQDNEPSPPKHHVSYLVTDPMWKLMLIAQYRR